MMDEVEADDEFETLMVARAEGWLDRPLRVEDGLNERSIAHAGERLHVVVPAELSAVYRCVGSVPELMNGFEQFRDPVGCEVDDGRLLFLDENQGVCAWGVDADKRVWMLTDDGFSPENAGLGAFLLTVLPYQLAQGGWPHTSEGNVQTPQLRSELARLATRLGWPLQADHNGLLIYGAGAHLLWALEPAPDESTASVYLSSGRDEEFYRRTEELGFSEL